MKIYDLRFTLFRRREPLTAESVQEVLHRLWQHGLRYSEEPTSEPLWEAQLQAKGRCYAEGKFHALSLTEASGLIARSTDGIVTLHDREFGLALRIGDDPSGQQPATFDTRHYERLHLWLDGAFALPGSEGVAPPTPALLQPYQQAGVAYAHWCQVLAQEAKAVVACGYDSESDTIFNAVRTWAASVLESGHLVVPPWSLMWYHEATAHEPVNLEEILSQPGALVQRTEQGGWWGLSHKWVVTFGQEAAAVQEERDAAHTYEIAVFGAITDREKRYSYAQIALRHYERALELARAAQDEEGEGRSAVGVAHMIEWMADLQRPPSDIETDADRRARIASMRAKFDQLQREHGN